MCLQTGRHTACVGLKLFNRQGQGLVIGARRIQLLKRFSAPRPNPYGDFFSTKHPKFLLDEV
jgi:hypothetical protein